MVVFERPIGAAPDTKELEYIAALHQTGTTLRPNGSIKDEDIKLYLRSRFGIEVTLEQVRSTIMHGFGGADAGKEDADAVIDLMELTAIILIPLLLKASIVEGEGLVLPEGVLPPPERLLQDTMKMIMHDSGATANASDLKTVCVNEDFIKDILLVYGETEMANDRSLIQEMIDACQGYLEDGEEDVVDAVFTPKIFGRALTRDVQMYNLKNETKQSSLIQDIFGDTRNTPKKNRHSEAVQTKNDDDQNNAEEPHTEDETKNTSQEQKKKNTGMEINEITRIYTAPAIDIQAGTYRSKSLIVTLWGSVLFGLVLLATDRSAESSECQEYAVPNGSLSENVGVITCSAASSILNWVIRFCVFCLAGLLFIGIGGLGNYVGNTRWYLPLIAIFCLVFYVFWPYFDGFHEENFVAFLRIMCTILGTITIYCHITHVATMIFKSYDFEKSRWGALLGFSALKQELQVKQASAYKLNQLAVNARDIHYRASSTTAFKTYFGHGLSSFALHGTDYVQVGGVFWFWRKFRDDTIFNQEGMWFSARLVAANLSQLIMSVFILMLGIYAMNHVIDNYGRDKAEAQLEWLVGSVMDRTIDENAISLAALDVLDDVVTYIKQFVDQFGIDCFDFLGGNKVTIDSICELDATLGTYNCSYLNSTLGTLCVLLETPDLHLEDPNLQLALLDAAGISTKNVFASIRTEVATALDSVSESLYPEELWMLTIPIGFGIAVAILNAFRLAISYLPSVTTTIIQLRTGVIPSLGDSSFEKYRVAPDSVTLLTGTLFWGCLVSSVLLGGVIAVIIFLFLWQGSVRLVEKFIILVIGLLVILLIRLSCVTCCKVSFFKGLYRSRPAGANIAMLALEWANYVFTTAFILVRMFKLLLVATSSIGKIDRPFLAKGVGQLGPLELDPYPTIHTRDLVAHDAHRHPYIETLGLMYLMKLRYADDFGNRAGSAWRLIFVYALMPWFHKYRVREDNKLELGVSFGDATPGMNEPSKDLVTLSQSNLSRPSFNWTPVDIDDSYDDPTTHDKAQINRQMEAENARLQDQVEKLTKQVEKMRFSREEEDHS